MSSDQQSIESSSIVEPTTQTIDAESGDFV